MKIILVIIIIINELANQQTQQICPGGGYESPVMGTN